MKVFVNIGTNFRDSFLDKATKDRIEKIAEVHYCEKEPLFGEELKNNLFGAEVLMTGWGQKEIRLADIPGVKLIIHTGGTVGGLIHPEVFEAGIVVLSGNHYFAESVAEGVIAYMLFALRDMGFNQGQLKHGIWEENRTRGLLDKKVGIVSLGTISKLVIGYLRYFQCEILVYSTRPNPNLAEEMGFHYASLDEIFSSCDIVSVHTARNPQTNKMIGEHHFSLLKDGTVFLNTSRGEVIDEEALIDALKTKQITAVLDVYNQEPLPKDHPLLSLPNAILFPHQCGPTFDRRVYITNRLIDDMEAFFKGDNVQNEISLEMMLHMTH